MTSKEFGKILQDKLTSEYGVELNVASKQQIYRSLALICRQMMSENYMKFQSKAIGTGTKQVYYLCMEFLMGRSLKMSLFNLGLDEVAKKALADADIPLDSIFEEEPDAGLGNGGLGRLAACYLDGMATTGVCGTGYSILYEYGIFKQKIVDGWQQERADNWLPGGQVWLKSHPDQAVEVRFDGEIRENWDNGFHYIQHTNYNSVMAVPSDMYVQGYDGKGVAKLRVVYLEEYCVSLSEHLMPAAEVSEQISLAGTEASGTGNMKFMLNGAITLGTLDGANVEIADAAGKENELIFGMLTPEVNNLKQVGYHPIAFITGDDVANYTLNFLERGWNGENFHEVTENLRTSDPYMVMADFKDYRRAQADLQKLYGDREKWAQMSLKNTANSGIFSADRAVLDYARDIWHASTVPMGK